MLKVSIALATYNGAEFLHEQLSSIAGQTVLPAELVVSDDGSTDDTLAIVRAFGTRAPFPVSIVANTERLGFADNFLHAAESCRHDLIALCDQDDVWLPGKIEAGARRIHEDGSLMSLHTSLMTDAALKQIGYWTQGIEADTAYEPLALDPYRTGWGNTMMFRRELVGLIPRERRPRQPEEPERPLSHDTWLYMLAAALGRVSHLMAPLILYRQHGANTMGFGAPVRWRRLAQMSRVPVATYREHALINARMASLFEAMSREPGPLAEAARGAAIRFGERHQLLASRVGVFEGTSFAARLGSYRASQKLAGTARPWIGSRVKDLALGVAGLSALGRASSKTPREPVDAG